MKKAEMTNEVKVFYIDDGDAIQEGTVVGKYIDIHDSWYEGYYYQIQRDKFSRIIERKQEQVYATREGAELGLAYLQARVKKATEERQLKSLEKAIEEVKGFLDKRQDMDVNMNALNLAKDEVVKIIERIKKDQEKLE